MCKFIRLRRDACLAAVVPIVAILLSISSVVNGGPVERPTVDDELMHQLKQLYQADDPEFVINRLAAESEASRLAGIARDLLGDSYAGSWFDDEALQLVVGTTVLSETDPLERLGIRVVEMEYSLSELKDLQEEALSDLESAGAWGGVVHSLYIDYPTNQVVISAATGSDDLVPGFLGPEFVDEQAFRIETSPGRDVPVASVRGADEYTNDVFDAQTSTDFKCSVGFSVVGGYLTAGHCGDQGHQVSGSNGTIQGSFSHSDVGGGEDRARVSTKQSWTPVPWINGYSDGLISVPAKWGALKEYPVNSTVCRYGQASDDSNCGVITQSNVTVNTRHDMRIQYYTITGLKRTSACVVGGDSGGPFVATADSQAQGITLTATNSPCPSNSNLLSEATFDPLAGPLQAFNSTMLTAHGANSPTIANFNCPDMVNSGSGLYFCEIEHYNAQGETGIQWSSNTGHSSQSVLLVGSCSSNQWVNVDLQLTNVYGNAQQSSGFWCPTAPPP